MFVKPTLLLDEKRCRANIARMSAKARKLGKSLRPHFKTHQSLKVGGWFREAGITAITVSSVDMAAYFASDGWDDITVAFPVNPTDASRIDALASSITFNCLVESTEAVGMLEERLTADVGIFVKVDTGYGRTGVRFDDTGALEEVIAAVLGSGRLRLKGFLAHAGHSYQATSREEILAINRQTYMGLSRAREIAGGGQGLVASLGDTPCCSVAEDFDGADELRPGNYVFNDMQQVSLGSCEPSDVAIAMACPVVAIHPSRGEIIVHGGAVHLSKDTYECSDRRRVFGQVVTIGEGGWSEPVDGARVVSVSQEHGKIVAPPDLLSSVSVGDTLGILPAHSCLTANLARGYTTLSREQADHMSGREWRSR